MSSAAPLHRPPALRPGDVVAVVAPSSPVPATLLDAGVDQLTQWGLQVQIGRHTLDRTHEEILAGSDPDRANDLQEAWLDPTVRAVFCARGGYGASRLLDHLDWTALRGARPKPLIGSSDVTALHAAVASHLGLATLFAPMVATGVFADPERRDATGVEALRRALFDDSDSDAPCLRAEGPVLGAHDRVESVVTGGTLTLLASLAGTPHLPAARGAIVALEDVGEEPYRVDRMLTQLRQAGWFDGVQGVAIGSFWECGDVEPVLVDRLGDLGVPLVCGFGFGHGDRHATLPLGAVAQLDPQRQTLQFTQSALAARR
jgi:muramoyltetrapeptide carboxypeptidase